MSLHVVTQALLHSVLTFLLVVVVYNKQSVLTGDAGIDDGTGSKTQLAKTEISLTLSNKFEVPENDHTDTTSTMLRSVSMHYNHRGART